APRARGAARRPTHSAPFRCGSPPHYPPQATPACPCARGGIRRHSARCCLRRTQLARVSASVLPPTRRHGGARRQAPSAREPPVARTAHCARPGGVPTAAAERPPPGEGLRRRRRILAPLPGLAPVRVPEWRRA